MTRYIPPGHAADCTCAICGTMWFLNLREDPDAFKKLRHFFKTKEMT